MDGIHRLLAYVVAVAVAVGLVAAAAPPVTRGFTRTTPDQIHAGVLAIIVVAAASGITLLVTGASPRDGLHFLYAGVAILLIPLARSFRGQLSDRARGLLSLATFVVLGALVYRLFATG